MGVDNHYLDHDYIFLKITDRNGVDCEIVMKRHEGNGDHLYDNIGRLEDCGDSWQLHTHADDIIVVGRWWSRKRIGYINGKVGWVCRNNDFLTHRLGVLMFAPLNMAIDLAFEMIGDPFIDEQIKGLTNDEVTAFITGPPYPTVSQKLQRIFFGEVNDESAPEESESDEGSDDDYDSSCLSSQSSSSDDYDYSSSGSSTTSANPPSNDGEIFPILMIAVALFICFLIWGPKDCQTTANPETEVKAPNNEHVRPSDGSWGGVIDEPPEEPKRTPYPWVSLPQSKAGENQKVPPTSTKTPTKSENVFDRELIDEERALSETEERLIQQELERRRRHPASPEQSRRAESAGRDAYGHSPFER